MDDKIKDKIKGCINDVINSLLVVVDTLRSSGEDKEIKTTTSKILEMQIEFYEMGMNLELPDEWVPSVIMGEDVSEVKTRNKNKYLDSPIKCEVLEFKKK